MRNSAFFFLYLFLFRAIIGNVNSSAVSVLVAVASSKTAAAGTTAGRSKRNNNKQLSLLRRRPSLGSTTTFRDAFIKGGLARCFGQAVLYPVDALRTLAQTRDGKTLADVGTKALLRGCFTTSSFALAMGALQFSIFTSLRDNTNVGPLIASMCGASASCIVSVPQEVIKQRLVTGIYPSFRNAVSSIAKEEGLRGFYSAWRPTMLRNVPFVMITFTTMDFCKQRLLRRKKKAAGGNREGVDNQSELSIGENMLLGMGSALFAGIITNPVDCVKTRLMTQAASSAIPYTSAFQCFTDMMQKEGLLAFYAGFPQRSIYMCGLWGITFALNGFLSQQKFQRST